MQFSLYKLLVCSVDLPFCLPGFLSWFVCAWHVANKATMGQAKKNLKKLHKTKEKECSK